MATYNCVFVLSLMDISIGFYWLSACSSTLLDLLLLLLIFVSIMANIYYFHGDRLYILDIPQFLSKHEGVLRPLTVLALYIYIYTLLLLFFFYFELAAIIFLLYNLIAKIDEYNSMFDVSDLHLSVSFILFISYKED